MRLLKTYEIEDCVIGLVRYTPKEMKKYKTKLFEVVWNDIGSATSSAKEQWNSFGGSVGYTCADFDTIEEAKKYIERGLKEEEINPEIWLEMVEVKLPKNECETCKDGNVNYECPECGKKGMK